MTLNARSNLKLLAESFKGPWNTGWKCLVYNISQIEVGVTKPERILRNRPKPFQDAWTTWLNF